MGNQRKGLHQQPDRTIGPELCGPAVDRRIDIPVHWLDFMAVCFTIIAVIASCHP